MNLGETQIFRGLTPIVFLIQHIPHRCQLHRLQREWGARSAARVLKRERCPLSTLITLYWNGLYTCLYPSWELKLHEGILTVFLFITVYSVQTSVVHNEHLCINHLDKVMFVLFPQGQLICLDRGLWCKATWAMSSCLIAFLKGRSSSIVHFRECALKRSSFWHVTSFPVPSSCTSLWFPSVLPRVWPSWPFQIFLCRFF